MMRCSGAMQWCGAVVRKKFIGLRSLAEPGWRGAGRARPRVCACRCVPRPVARPCSLRAPPPTRRTSQVSSSQSTTPNENTSAGCGAHSGACAGRRLLAAPASAGVRGRGCHSTAQHRLAPHPTRPPSRRVVPPTLLYLPRAHDPRDTGRPLLWCTNAHTPHIVCHRNSFPNPCCAPPPHLAVSAVLHHLWRAPPGVILQAAAHVAAVAAHVAAAGRFNCQHARTRM